VSIVPLFSQELFSVPVAFTDVRDDIEGEIMFCPRCGLTQDDELKFCKSCGVNLYAVRRVVDTRQAEMEPDRNTPWFAEMSLHEAESRRRREELDHRRGITPEVQRFNEIKGGVITASVGLGITIFLYYFMQGLILSGAVAPDTAQILARIWIAGIIPFAIGMALIINGVVVTKRLAEVVRRSIEPGEGPDTTPLKLRSPDPTNFMPTNYSVTEDTTKHLNSDAGKN
jgi:hypothetical protein